MNESFEVTKAACISKMLIEAALANRDIRAYISDLTPPRLWTIESVSRNPTCRVEWEDAIVIGGVGESLAAARHKRWGRFIGVLPLRSDDPVGYSRILYCYKSTSVYNRRVEQRKALKRILGRSHRKLVAFAATSTKKDFLNYHLTEAGAEVIRRRLHLDPGRFWRVAKGKEFLDLPKLPAQLPLFTE